MSTHSRFMTVAVAAAVAAGMGGCTPDFANDNTSPVLFIVVDINGGAPLDSDVLSGSISSGFFIEEDEVPVTIAVRPKNPNFENVPQVAAAVLIQRYEVRYFRSDGRNAEGVDVPFRISGNISTAADAGTDAAENVTFQVEVVRRQAKVEPPLRNIAGGGGEFVLTCFAEITIHGRTIAGQAVQASGRLQIDFADFISTN